MRPITVYPTPVTYVHLHHTPIPTPAVSDMPILYLLQSRHCIPHLFWHTRPQICSYRTCHRCIFAPHTCFDTCCLTSAYATPAKVILSYLCAKWYDTPVPLSAYHTPTTDAYYHSTPAFTPVVSDQFIPYLLQLHFCIIQLLTHTCPISAYPTPATDIFSFHICSQHTCLISAYYISATAAVLYYITVLTQSFPNLPILHLLQIHLVFPHLSYHS